MAKTCKTDFRFTLQCCWLREYSTYDKGRAYTEAQLKLWLGKVVLHGRLRKGSAVLDLGCGTGRYAVPLAERHRCFVVGLDNSAGMLREAKNKSKVRNLCWVNADGEHLPYVAGTTEIKYG